MNTKGLSRLFTFKGYRIESITFSEKIVQVILEIDKRFSNTCPACGSRKGFIEESAVREVRDLPMATARLVYISYPAQKFRCRRCASRKWISPPGIDTNRGATERFMHYASFLMCFLPVSRAGVILNVQETRLRRWDKAVLEKHLGEPDFDDLNQILVDEKAIGKGHQYITVVLNGETGDLLHCHEGRKKESLKAFFNKLTEEQKASIDVVCIDRSGAYQACIEEEVPHADIAFDKFHLVKNLNDEIDKIRREEWNRLRKEKDEEGADIIKGNRYNLLRRPEKNTHEQQERLNELLKENRSLSIAYVLLEDFRDALSQRYVRHAKTALEMWIDTASGCGVEKLTAFAGKVSKASSNILNAIRHKISNGLLEGFNNLISRIIHRANGYQDLDYLFLKLRQASMPDDLKVPGSQK